MKIVRKLTIELTKTEQKQLNLTLKTLNDFYAELSDLDIKIKDKDLNALLDAARVLEKATTVGFELEKSKDYDDCEDGPEWYEDDDIEWEEYEPYEE